MKKVFLLLFIHFWSMDSFAQVEQDTTAIVLEGVVVQSDIFQVDKKDFGGSVSIVTPKTLNQSEGVYLQPVLNSVPGVYMQSGALNTNRITIRGIGSRTPFGTDKIKAYLDEIPLSTGEGETTVEDLDFQTLGGIEVYRGPSSTTYGAGLGGAIHMLTKKPEQGARVMGGYTFGSYGLSSFDLSGEVGSDEQFLGVYYQDISSEGYRDNNEYDRQSLTLLSKVSIGSKSTVTAYFNSANLIAEIPSSINKEMYDSIPSAAEPRWGGAEGFEENQRLRFGLSMSSDWDEKTESTVAGFVNLGSSDEVRPVFLGNTDADFRNLGFRGRLKRKFGSAEKLSVVLGGEVFFEDYRYQEFENRGGQNGLKNLDFDQNRNYGNVFLVGEFRPSKHWILSVGGNMNFSKYKNQDLLPTDSTDYRREYSFGSIFSPKVSLSRAITDYVTVYGMYSHGFSLPTFEQTLFPQEGDSRINEDIKEEVGNNFEIGMKGDFLNSALHFELAAYHMDVKDLLVTETLETGTYSVNAGSADFNGIELMMAHQLIQTEKINLSHTLSYAWMNYQFDDFTHRGEDYSGNVITGVPTYTIDYSIGANLGFGLYGSAHYQGAGDIYLRDDNTEKTDSYGLVNLKIGYTREVGNFELDINTGVNNATDTKYASMIQPNAFGGRYYYPGLPTNYYSRIRITYNIK